MKTKGRQRDRSGERGQGFIELGIMLIALLILLAGIVDIGRALFNFVALRDASQEGAMYGSFCPVHDPADTADDDLETRVRESSANPIDLSSSDVTVFSNCDPDLDGDSILCEQGESITVTVGIPNFPVTMPFIGALIGTQIIPLESSETIIIVTDEYSCPP